MTKRIVCFLCTLMICFGIFQLECAAGVIEPARSCSLTLSYARNGKGFSDLQIDIYRVAELSSDGQYKLLEPFSNYPINIYGITSQQQWQDIAETIRSYIAANQIEAYQSQKTDKDGYVSFGELETGLYMVKGTKAQNDNTVYMFRDFMVYLPTPVDGDYDYDVEAKPKYTEYTQPAGYTVVKLWKDSDVSANRPEAVEVEILKDGVVRESVRLNSSNNWSYSWEVSDKDGVWSVMEKNVPEGYQVSITSTDTTFIITNAKSPSVPDDPDTPKEPDETNAPDKPDPADKTDQEGPKTGDTSPLLLYVILVCISGLGLIILGVLKRGEGRNEKKR